MYILYIFWILKETCPPSVDCASLTYVNNFIFLNITYLQIVRCASEETWTLTVSLQLDFESNASTNSATEATKNLFLSNLVSYL